MPKRSGLSGPVFDASWVERGLSKHDANYSMVVGFESSDARRLRQLREYLISVQHGPGSSFKDHDIFEFDPWLGLGQVSREDGRLHAAGRSEGRFSEELGSNVKALDLALGQMDAALRESSSVFIIHGVSKNTPGVERLNAALRSWAFADDLIHQASLVLVFSSALRDFLEDDTLQQIPVIEVELASVEEYAELVEYLSSLCGLTQSGDETGAICNSLRGLNLRQAEAVLRESYKVHSLFDLEHISKAKGGLIAATGLLEIDAPSVDFSCIGGYQSVKDFIKNKVIRVLSEPERASQFAIPLPRGVLLFGPPGTGKTLFSQALANEVHLPFIRLRTENIYSSLVGVSGQRLRSAIGIAERMSPAIVFVDEVDRFGKRYGAQSSAGEEFRRVFSQMLEWLGDESRRAILIGTTNDPTSMDEAFLRTGRFDYKIPLLYPDEEGRREILLIHFGLPSSSGERTSKPQPPIDGTPQSFGDFLAAEIVPRTHNYSGAELEELVTRSKRSAFERGHGGVAQSDVLRSLEAFRIDWEEREQKLTGLAAEVRRFCDDETFVDSRFEAPK